MIVRSLNSRRKATLTMILADGPLGLRTFVRPDLTINHAIAFDGKFESVFAIVKDL